MDLILGFLILGLLIYGIYVILKFIFFKKTAPKIPQMTQEEKQNKEAEERKKLTEILNNPFEYAPEDSLPFFVFFDTETTGFVPDDTDVKNFEEFPFPVQLAWSVHDYEGRLIKQRDFILLQPTEIPKDAAKIHKITTQKMNDLGVDPIPVYEEFVSDLKSCQYLVAHNLEYDDKVIKAEFHRKGLKPSLLSKKRICTMKKFKKFCDIPFSSGTGTKFPKLSEFAVCAFSSPINPSRFSIQGGHNAMTDVNVTAKCFFEMLHTWRELEIEKE